MQLKHITREKYFEKNGIRNPIKDSLGKKLSYREWVDESVCLSYAFISAKNDSHSLLDFTNKIPQKDDKELKDLCNIIKHHNKTKMPEQSEIINMSQVIIKKLIEYYFPECLN